MPLLQTKDLPKGTPEFERTRERLIQELSDSIPKQYYLPESTVKNAKADVTNIPRTCGVLSPDETKLTQSHDATSLAAAIARKELTAVAVVTAFAKRAAVAHQLTCCLTQFFLEEALDRARYLDDYLQKNGKTVGPLHGVPISIKEHIAIAGHYSSYGFLSTRVKNDEDAYMVKLLRDAGAVFYVKTNQPQAIMHLESDSWYGRVNNPLNVHLSAGGSTGGEAALIAMQGSVMGVGTDIGGSVRGPSAFCGIFGFKPTSYTLSMKDFLPGGFPAELNILCSTGPMCRSLRDLDLFMDLIVGSKQYLQDPRIIPIPWTGLNTPISTPIKLGIMLDDGNITPQPPVLEALKWAQAKLSSNPNFVLKPYKPYNAAEAITHISRMYWPESGLAVKAALASTGEPIYPLTKNVLSHVTQDFTTPNGPERERTAREISSMRVTRDTFRMAFAQHWEQQDVDFVLAPAFVGPACKHDTALYWNYTALWNFVDYPGVVVPTPIVAEKDMTYAADYKGLSDKCLHVKEMWEEGGFEGAPVDLQVIGRRYFDNELIACVGAMEKVLGNGSLVGR